MAFGAEAQFHVLAVDDSRLDRKLIERLLKTSSYHVTAVDSGRKALEFLGVQEDETCSPSSQQDITVSLIITDYSMPGMTGYDLLKKIKESSVLKDIPVVIMSSENVPSRINRCLEEGAEEFLLKPVQLSDMKRLRPHILRSKEQEADQFHHHHHQQNQWQPTQPQPAEQRQQQQGLNSSTCKKRKAMDGGLSAERTRQRPSSSYGLFTIV